MQYVKSLIYLNRFIKAFAALDGTKASVNIAHGSFALVNNHASLGFYSESKCFHIMLSFTNGLVTQHFYQDCLGFISSQDVDNTYSAWSIFDAVYLTESCYICDVLQDIDKQHLDWQSVKVSLIKYGILKAISHRDLELFKFRFYTATPWREKFYDFSWSVIGNEYDTSDKFTEDILINQYLSKMTNLSWLKNV